MSKRNRRPQATKRAQFTAWVKEQKRLNLEDTKYQKSEECCGCYGAANHQKG